MPTMKLTFSAAMRARDVSRPRPEHLAAAEAAEPGVASGSRARAASGDAAKPTPRRTGRRETGGAAGSGAAGSTKAGGAETGAKPGSEAGGAAADGARRGRPGFPRRRHGSRDDRRRGRGDR